MKKRKKFECGHKGYGKYCHLCKQIEDGKKQQEHKKSKEYQLPKLRPETNDRGDFGFLNS